MTRHTECIHWEICALACPLVVDECPYYQTFVYRETGRWIRVEGTDMYQCSNCNTVGQKTDYFCKTCGSQNVEE